MTIPAANKDDMDVFFALCSECKDYVNSMALIDDSQRNAAIHLFEAGLIEIMPFDGWLYCYFTPAGRKYALDNYNIIIAHPMPKDFDILEDSGE